MSVMTKRRSHRRLLFLLACLVVSGLSALAAAPRMDTLCLLQQGLHAGDPAFKGWSCLHHAAARGATGVIDEMLAYGSDIDERTAQGLTPLALAARRGQIEAVDHLLTHNAALTPTDNVRGFTPLHEAAEHQHAAVLRRLLRAGADPDARNQWRQTPLWQAAWQAWHDNTQIARLLVAFGAEIDLPDDKGHTPLHMAARSGHTPLVAYLLDQGAAINHPSDRGRTPLYQAVVANARPAARLLLQHGADPNVSIEGWTPLRLALHEQRYRLADMLVEAGANGYERYAAEARVQQGRQLLEQTRFEQAIVAFDKAIAMAPDQPEGYYGRGVALARSGRMQEAADELQRSLGINPDHAGALEWLGVARANQGEHQQAITPLQALTRTRPDYGRGWHLLGRSLAALGETEQAGAAEATACRLGYQPACDNG